MHTQIKTHTQVTAGRVMLTYSSLGGRNSFKTVFFLSQTQQDTTAGQGDDSVPLSGRQRDLMLPK